MARAGWAILAVVVRCSVSQPSSWTTQTTTLERSRCQEWYSAHFSGLYLDAASDKGQCQLDDDCYICSPFGTGTRATGAAECGQEVRKPCDQVTEHESQGCRSVEAVRAMAQDHLAEGTCQVSSGYRTHREGHLGSLRGSGQSISGCQTGLGPWWAARCGRRFWHVRSYLGADSPELGAGRRSSTSGSATPCCRTVELSRRLQTTPPRTTTIAAAFRGICTWGGPFGVCWCSGTSHRSGYLSTGSASTAFGSCRWEKRRTHYVVCSPTRSLCSRRPGDREGGGYLHRGRLAFQGTGFGHAVAPRTARPCYYSGADRSGASPAYDQTSYNGAISDRSTSGSGFGSEAGKETRGRLGRRSSSFRGPRRRKPTSNTAAGQHCRSGHRRGDGRQGPQRCSLSRSGQDELIHADCHYGDGGDTSRRASYGYGCLESSQSLRLLKTQMPQVLFEGTFGLHHFSCRPGRSTTDDCGVVQFIAPCPFSGLAFRPFLIRLPLGTPTFQLCGPSDHGPSFSMCRCRDSGWVYWFCMSLRCRSPSSSAPLAPHWFCVWARKAPPLGQTFEFLLLGQLHSLGPVLYRALFDGMVFDGARPLRLSSCSNLNERLSWPHVVKGGGWGMALVWPVLPRAFPSSSSRVPEPHWIIEVSDAPVPCPAFLHLPCGPGLPDVPVKISCEGPVCSVTSSLGLGPCPSFGFGLGPLLNPSSAVPKTCIGGSGARTVRSWVSLCDSSLQACFGILVFFATLCGRILSVLWPYRRLLLEHTRAGLTDLMQEHLGPCLGSTGPEHAWPTVTVLYGLTWVVGHVLLASVHGANLLDCLETSIRAWGYSFSLAALLTLLVLLIRPLRGRRSSVLRGLGPGRAGQTVLLTAVSGASPAVVVFPWERFRKSRHQRSPDLREANMPRRMGASLRRLLFILIFQGLTQPAWASSDGTGMPHIAVLEEAPDPHVPMPFASPARLPEDDGLVPPHLAVQTGAWSPRCSMGLRLRRAGWVFVGTPVMESKKPPQCPRMSCRPLSCQSLWASDCLFHVKPGIC